MALALALVLMLRAKSSPLSHDGCVKLEKIEEKGKPLVLRVDFPACYIHFDAKTKQNKAHTHSLTHTHQTKTSTKPNVDKENYAQNFCFFFGKRSEMSIFSIFAARMKSFSWSPPILCVKISTVSSFHCSR